MLKHVRTEYDYAKNCQTLLWKCHLIYEIKAILLQLKQQRKIVHLLWVPIHIGIDGNEHVDSIASNQFSHTLSMPILHSDTTATNRSNAITQWQNK